MEPEADDRPRLRPIEAIAMEREGQPTFCLRDPTGESQQVLFVSEATMWMLARLDGSRDLGDLQADICRASGEIVPRSALEELIVRLEEASFLDSKAFRERKRIADEAFARSQWRPAVFAGGGYPEDPQTLRNWIAELLDRARSCQQEGIRALIAPHIDPHRGASVYGSAYRALRGSPASRIIILGISHTGGGLPYATIDKDFETPLGSCGVDRPFLERLHRGLPFDPLTEQRLHQREHSIEFQAVFLRHVLDGWDRRRIVPILCCFPWTPEGSEPSLPYPASLREAFTQRLAELIDEETLVVAGVDFAHVGKRFGDPSGSVVQRRAAIEEHDRSIMERIAEGDLPGFRHLIEETQDAFRICGYPALITLLETVRYPGGIVLDYGQAVEEATDSLVSFAAMALR